MDGYKRGGHSKYSLKAHIIFVTKYRKRLFKSRVMAEAVKQFLYDAARKYGYAIIRMETDEDHIHILLEYKPTVFISELVKQLKQYSTHLMWRNYRAYLAKQYWKHQILWSDGYFASSIGQVSQEIVERYIQNQG